MQEGSTQEDHVSRTSSLLLTWPSPFRYYADHDGGPSSATTSGAAISNNSYANCAASCTSSGYGPLSAHTHARPSTLIATAAHHRRMPSPAPERGNWMLWSYPNAIGQPSL